MARKTDVQYIKLYTDGSAARRLTPELPERPERPQNPPPRKKPRYVQVYPLASVGLIVAVVMLVLMVVGMGRLRTAQKEAADMERRVAQLQEENQLLQDKYDSGYDLEAVERIARAMGMIPKEEAEHVELALPPETETAQPSFWERVCTFFRDLFA